MAKKKNKEVLTIEDVLKRKKFFEEKKVEKKELYIKSIDANIVVQKPSKEILLELLDMEEDEGNAYVAYSCIVEPDLHDSKIQDAYKDNINEPWDVLYEIFDPGEVTQIALNLGDFAGMNGVEDANPTSPADLIKNDLKK